MKKINNRINSLYINIIIIFIFELIFSLSIFKTISIVTGTFILISSSVTGLIIKLLCSFFNKKINIITNLLLLIIIDILFIGQFFHYKLYSILFSTYSLLHSGQIFEWFDYILKIILDNWYVFVLFVVPIILLIIFKKKIEYSKINNINRIKYLLMLILLIAIFHISLNIDKKDNYSRYNLYYNVYSSTLTANKFGVIITMKLDLQRYIFGFNDKLSNNNESSIKTINNYINNQEISNKNKYTDLFKNKNLIVVTAESFTEEVIDKDLTPTLYKLYNEGFKFNNFYTPIYYASTSDGEYVVQTSLLPTEGTWSLNESYTHNMSYSLGNLFKDNGYRTYAYHNGYYEFYNRNLTHPNIGYDSFTACGNGLEKKINCDIWPKSDLEMIENTFDDYKNNEKFLVYYMTISGHLSYNFTNNKMAIKNKEAVKSSSYSTSEKAYLAANIELDKALEKLIENLRNNKLLDDTVILLSADHYPYGLTNNELNDLGLNFSNDEFDKHKNALIIWNNKINEEINIDKYSCSLDILPTIYNLFGISYDSRLLMGNDILSNQEGIVIFNNRSWITKYGKYNSLTKEFINFTNERLPKDYIKKINDIVYDKFAISRMIYNTNYYEYIKKDS